MNDSCRVAQDNSLSKLRALGSWNSDVADSKGVDPSSTTVRVVAADRATGRFPPAFRWLASPVMHATSLLPPAARSSGAVQNRGRQWHKPLAPRVRGDHRDVAFHEGQYPAARFGKASYPASAAVIGRRVTAPRSSFYPVIALRAGCRRARTRADGGQCSRSATTFALCRPPHRASRKAAAHPHNKSSHIREKRP